MSAPVWCNNGAPRCQDMVRTLAQMDPLDIPPGFEPLFRTSPFLETVGPIFYRKEAGGTFVIGMRILGKHANARGAAHGGLLMTLLDIALGYRSALTENPPANLITANLSADF